MQASSESAETCERWRSEHKEPGEHGMKHAKRPTGRGE